MQIRVYSKCPYCGAHYRRVRHADLRRDYLMNDLLDAIRREMDWTDERPIPPNISFDDLGIDEFSSLLAIEHDFREMAGLPTDRYVVMGNKDGWVAGDESPQQRTIWTPELLVDYVLQSVLKAEEIHQAYLNSRSMPAPGQSS